jgi:hypothetical protein
MFVYFLIYPQVMLVLSFDVMRYGVANIVQG